MDLPEELLHKFSVICAEMNIFVEYQLHDAGLYVSITRLADIKLPTDTDYFPIIEIMGPMADVTYPRTGHYRLEPKCNSHVHLLADIAVCLSLEWNNLIMAQLGTTVQSMVQ